MGTVLLTSPATRMGNKAGKNKVTDEDMKFLMSKVEDPSGNEEGKSTFYRLDFTDSGHTKARIKEWEEGKVNDLNKSQFLSMVTEFGIMGTPKNFEALFDGFDTDGDGVISLKEFVLLIRVMSDDAPEDKIKWGFKAYDENNDGFFDGEALAEAVVQKLDTNQDGKISLEEAMYGCMTDKEILRLLNLSVNKHFRY